MAKVDVLFFCQFFCRIFVSVHIPFFKYKHNSRWQEKKDLANFVFRKALLRTMDPPPRVLEASN